MNKNGKIKALKPKTAEQIKKELIKEIELQYKKSKYKLKIELDKSRKTLIFELKLTSPKSFYFFQKIYKYDEMINHFKLSQSECNNILKIYEHLKEIKIINIFDDFIKIKANNKYEIKLNKIKKDMLNNNIQKSKENMNLKKNDIKPKKEINNNEIINLKQSIKSVYIIKEIFSLLDIWKKLNMVKYSKLYQNLLNININNYKERSDKYIVAEKDGKVKEYNKKDNKLIYEGEYLNGKRNGKG